MADGPARLAVTEETVVVCGFHAHLAHIELDALHVLLRIVVLGMVHVQFLILRAAGIDCLPKLAVPRGGEPPRVAVVEQAHAAIDNILQRVETIQVEGFLGNFGLAPSQLYTLPEVLVVQVQVGLLEVGEEGHAAEAPQFAVRVLGFDIAVPFRRIADGIQQLGQVLHVLLVGL